MSTVESQAAEQHASAPSPAPKVSVVIPCLNEAQNIEECVRRAWAAIEGAGLDGEGIVSDNNSTDGSGALAEGAPGGWGRAPCTSRGPATAARTSPASPPPAASTS